MYVMYKDLSVNMYIHVCVCVHVCVHAAITNSIKHFQSQSKGNDGREKQLSWGKRRN